MKKIFASLLPLGALALLALPSCNNNTSLPSSPFVSGNPTQTFSPVPSASFTPTSTPTATNLTPTFTPTATPTSTATSTPTNTLQTPDANTTMTETPNPAQVHLSPTTTVTPIVTATPSGLTPTPTPTPFGPSSWSLFAILGQPGATGTYGANGYFGEPEGIAIGNGFIAVSDNAVTNIQVFNADGQYLYSISPAGTSPFLLGMAIDSNDELYVADYGDDNVQGYFLGSTGAAYDYAWSGQGTFTGPTGVKIDGQGNLVVCDEVNSAVYNVAWTDDTLLAASTGNPAGDNSLGTYSPSDVALDPAGNLDVADFYPYNNPNGGRIAQYNPGYAYTGSISGSTWTLPLNNPVYSLVPDSQGNFFVSDPSNGRVVYMTAQGGYLGEIDGFNITAYLAVDNSNNLFVVDKGAGQVLEYTQ